MFYFIRHGETDINAIGGINTFDTPLNENGKKQVAVSSKELRGLNIKQLYSSDTLRTKQTAEIVNEVADLHLEIYFDARLREFGLGEFEGTTKLKDLELRFGEIYKDPVKYGIESLQDAFNRVRSFFAETENSAANQDVCVVCHGGIMHMIRYAYFYDEFDAKRFTQMSTKKFANAEIIQLDLNIPRNKRQH